MSAEATNSRRRTVFAGVAVALAGAIVLRFLTFSALWLDEAQTVAIARRPLPQLFEALRHDGSPPLFYVVLHGWMSLFGTSDFAVRALSGVFAVAALPLIWFAAREIGLDRFGRWAAVLLLAANPMAIRYASEARMYSLLVALWLAAFIALMRWGRDGTWWYGALGSVAVAALLLTHYWSLFALTAVGLGALIAGLRGDQRGWRILGAILVGALGFLPWLGSFIYQARHTGAPWGPPPAFARAFDAPIAWAGTGPAGSSVLLGLIYYALAVVAVAGICRPDGLAFGRPWRRTAVLLVGLAVGTLLLGITVGELTHSAYAPRYSLVALPPFLLAAAVGAAALLPRWRNLAIAGTVALGLVVGATYPTRNRTDVADVAAALSTASRTDTVVFCPDQLGPAVHRLAPDAGRQVVFPTMGSATMVDWVDYTSRNEAANVSRFAQDLVARTPSNASIWLVYANGYPTFGNDCTDLLVDLTVARGRPQQILAGDDGPGEQGDVMQFRGS
jgi:mannosyltransferase